MKRSFVLLFGRGKKKGSEAPRENHACLRSVKQMRTEKLTKTKNKK